MAVVSVVLVGVIALGSKDDSAKDDTDNLTTSNTTEEESTLNSTDSNTTNAESTSENSSESETTTINVADNETTENSSSEETTTTINPPETTTNKPKETTTKKQDPTVNITTTTPAPTKYDEHYGETYTSHNIETHPVDPGWDEEETTKDYSDSEICTNSHVKDYNEIAPVYEDQLIDEIQYKTTYIRNWINYSLKNAPDAWLVEAIVLYLETHDPNTFNYIKIDNYNGDNWRRILAAEIWNGHNVFDWNFINEYYKIYNNLLWDCVYNDDFTNIKFLDIPSNEINFENNEDGTNVSTLIKISFSSGGASYIAWFTQGGGFIPSTGDYNLIDIDKIK